MQKTDVWNTPRVCFCFVLFSGFLLKQKTENYNFLPIELFVVLCYTLNVSFLLWNGEKMNIDKFFTKVGCKVSGKLVAISGSTGGLGRELCRYFAGLGAELILIDRNKEKSEKLADELKTNYPSVQIRHIQADMSDMSSVKLATERLLSMNPDYLILNAGAYSIPRCVCDTGYDNVFQINFVSPYYMAKKLLPSIRSLGGRVIAVGSIAHNYSKIDLIDIDFKNRKKASLVYGNAKRYLTYSLLALSDGDVVIAHPGITFTGITNHYPPLIFALIKHPMKLIFMKPKKAALSILYATFADCAKGEWIGPSLFDVWGMPKVKKLRTADEVEIQNITRIAEEIYNKTNN